MFWLVHNSPVPPGHAKVRDFCAVEAVQKHVGGLQVLVDDRGVQVEEAHADVLANPVAEQGSMRFDNSASLLIR